MANLTRFADITSQSELAKAQAARPPVVLLGQGSGVKNWILHNEARIDRLEMQVLLMHNELVALRATNTTLKVVPPKTVEEDEYSTQLEITKAFWDEAKCEWEPMPFELWVETRNHQNSAAMGWLWNCPDKKPVFGKPSDCVGKNGGANCAIKAWILPCRIPEGSSVYGDSTEELKAHRMKLGFYT